MENEDKIEEKITLLVRELKGVLNLTLKLFFDKNNNEWEYDAMMILLIVIPSFLSDLSFCVTDKSIHESRKVFIKKIFDTSMILLDHTNNQKKEHLN